MQLKKLLISIGFIVGAIFTGSAVAYATSTLFEYQGGTGFGGATNNVTPGAILFGNYGLTTLATSTNLTFATSTNKFSTTYASTTGASGNFLCLGSDCRTAWPTGGGSTFGTTSISALLPLIWNTTTAQLSTLFSTSTTWGIGNNGFVVTGATGIPFVAASSTLNLPNSALQNSSITVNGTTFNLGETHTITAASSSILGDFNTFSGTDYFNNPIKIGTLGGLIAGNSGLTYAVSTTSMNASITGSAGSVGSSITFNSSGGAAANSSFNGSVALTVDYHTVGAQVAGTYLSSYDAWTHPLSGWSATSSILYPNGLFTGTSTIGVLVASSSITNQAVKSALVLNSAAGLEGSYGGSNPCSANTAALSINATGVISCTGTFVPQTTNVNTTFPLQNGGALSGNLTLTSAFSTTTNTGMSAGNSYIGSNGVMQTTASSTLFGATTAGYVWSYQNGGAGWYATSTAGGGSGTVTQVNTNYSMTGGGFTTSGTLAVATSSLYTGLAGGLPYFSGTNTLGAIAAGTGGYILSMSGGIPAWVATSSINNGVTSITASTPLTGGTITTTGSIGCTTASSGVAGCLGSTAFDTFNNKQAALSTPTYPLLLTGTVLSTAFGTTSNSGMTAGNLYVGSNGIFQTSASSSIFGYTPLNPSRNVNTTYPLQGGGALTGDLTLTNAFGTTTNTGISAGGMYVGSDGVLRTTASSTFLGTGTGGQVWGWSNATGGAGWIATSTTAGTTYTGTYPIIVSGTTISSGFGTTTTWGMGNNGLVMTGSTGIPFSQATSSTIALSSLTLSTQLGVASGGTGANTLTGCLTGNGTGAITGSGTCNTSNATVSSITAGLGLNGGAITTSGTINLKSYIATSTADTANQLVAFTSTNGTPATIGGYSGYTLTSTGITLTNASTTQLTVGTGLQIPHSANPAPTTVAYCAQSTNSPYQIQCGNNAGGTSVYDSRTGISFYISSTTAMTASTSMTVSVPTGFTATSGQCTVQPAGATAEVQWYYANPTAYTSTTAIYWNASSTPGLWSISSNNTPATSATSTLIVGNFTGSPTSVACNVFGAVTGI